MSNTPERAALVALVAKWKARAYDVKRPAPYMILGLAEELDALLAVSSAGAGQVLSDEHSAVEPEAVAIRRRRMPIEAVTGPSGGAGSEEYEQEPQTRQRAKFTRHLDLPLSAGAGEVQPLVDALKDGKIPATGWASDKQPEPRAEPPVGEVEAVERLQSWLTSFLGRSAADDAPDKIPPREACYFIPEQARQLLAALRRASASPASTRVELSGEHPEIPVSAVCVLNGCQHIQQASTASAQEPAVCGWPTCGCVQWCAPLLRMRAGNAADTRTPSTQEEA